MSTYEQINDHEFLFGFPIFYIARAIDSCVVAGVGDDGCSFIEVFTERIHAERRVETLDEYCEIEEIDSMDELEEACRHYRTLGINHLAFDPQPNLGSRMIPISEFNA